MHKSQPLRRAGMVLLAAITLLPVAAGASDLGVSDDGTPLLARGGGGSGSGGGRGGGFGPGDGSGAGTAPRDGSGNGAQTGDCTNS